MNILAPSLEICGPQGHRSRRNFLHTAGGLLFFDSLARALSVAAASPRSDPARPRSVILLWLDGGASQLETFDPHPGGRIGGEVKAIPTSSRGLQIADNLPQLAQWMHHAAVLRSVVGNEGDHARAQYHIKTGYRPDPTLVHPAVGAILCHQSDSDADIPRHVSILPGPRPGRGGYLGSRFDAFKVYDPAQPVPDVSKRIDDERYQQRIGDLLEVAESQFRLRRIVDLERQRTLHAATTQQALTMMSSDQLDAFDVSRESSSCRDAFGETPFGRGCLAAARLIEVGVRCVEVTLGGWDSHLNNHALQRAACGILDPAAAALIDRLEQRELLDTTLVVIAGEFGRTPQINPAGGRDHWVHGFSVVLAGGGIRGGAVHGATAADADFDPQNPLEGVHDAVGIAGVHATILAALGLDPRFQVDTSIGRPMHLSEGKPLPGLLQAG